MIAPRYSRSVSDSPLPIVAALPELRTRLHESPLVLLQAPPGAGKSTALPLALLDEPYLRGRRMLMLEPRRVAARAVAARMAESLGEPIGATVGYQIRFERRIGRHTRIEVLTEGVLTRMLQDDPSLDGVGLVVFDEFHERSLHADLALALCRDVQSSLREDLRLLVMSATLDASISAGPLAHFPLVQAHARSFPVEIIYAEREPVGPLPAQVAAAAARALAEHPGDVLAFLPGVGEIQRARDLLLERGVDADVRTLFGEMPLDEQQSVLRAHPNARRRIVLATAIAETSLTIEGVRAVVDCGFSRTARFDPSSDLTRLETVRVTVDAADQRAGRAGRLGPGACYRLWTAGAHHSLGAARRPEIVDADLAPLRLELAQWGIRDPLNLAWVTPPPSAALRRAEQLLESLDALHDGKITPRGRAMAEWPTHPRLAHLLIESGRSAPLAADVAALLPALDVQVHAYVEAVRDPIVDAALAGAIAFSSGLRADVRARVAASEVLRVVSRRVEQDVARPIRERVAEVTERAAGDGDRIAVDVRDVYREWKVRIMERVAHDLARLAYARGAFLAMPTGTRVCWVADPDGPECAEALDNALAGSQRVGEAFPTGDEHPTAHPGCRCMVIPTPH